jgi:hypothetical protein
VVSFKPLSLLPAKISPYLLDRKVGRPQGRCGRCGVKIDLSPLRRMEPRFLDRSDNMLTELSGLHMWGNGGMAARILNFGTESYSSPPTALLPGNITQYISARKLSGPQSHLVALKRG